MERTRIISTTDTFHGRDFKVFIASRDDTYALRVYQIERET